MSAELPEIALAAGTRVIADLHLDPRAEPAWRGFQAWLAELAGAPALLVLGDLFEYWIGPAQQREPAYAALLAALRARAQAGTALHFLHGNRDFLLGASFARAVGGHVHPRGCVGLLADGSRVLFLHGDELATLDTSYQRLRAVLRSPLLRGAAAAVPAPLARLFARRLRARSRRAVAAKSPAAVELQPAAVAEWCARARAQLLVCGHAHRFQERTLPGGLRWLVLDAFGGARDVLRLDGAAGFVPENSRAALPPGAPTLSSWPMASAPRRQLVLAIDGPAGVGKSSVARAVARALGLFFLDTGAMYRAVTLAVLERGLEPADGAACAGVARELVLGFDAHGKVLLDGRAGEPAIRGAAVTAAVSQVSAHAGVRAAVVARQRELAGEHAGVVAEGRDTATVVFPDAQHKFYLDASVAERARRRARQEHALARLAEIEADIARRDALDSTRVHAPLRVAEGAVRVDTDGLDLEAVVARILAHVRGDHP